MSPRKKGAKPTKAESSINDSFDEELAKQIYSQPNTNYEVPENQGLGTILEVNESEAQSADSSRNLQNGNGNFMIKNIIVDRDQSSSTGHEKFVEF